MMSASAGLARSFCMGKPPRMMVTDGSRVMKSCFKQPRAGQKLQTGFNPLFKIRTRLLWESNLESIGQGGAVTRAIQQVKKRTKARVIEHDGGMDEAGCTGM